MDSDHNLETELRKISKIINEAFTRLQSGDVPNLNDLENTVKIFCRDLSKASPETSRQIKPLVATLIQNLDDLEKEIKSGQDRLTGKKTT